MDLEQQLRAALVPCEPGPEPEAAVMARVSAAVRRKPSRVILFGTLLVVAAAAAMLTEYLRGTPESTVVVVAPVPVTAAQVVAAVTDASPPLVSAPAPQPVDQKPAPREAVPAIRSFNLLVRPLQNNTTDAASKAAVDLFYTSLLDGLRAVPGLTLIDADSARAVPAYWLTIVGSGPAAGIKFNVSVAENVIPLRDGGFGASSVRNLTADIAPACSGSTATGADQPDCADPVSLAATTLEKLRMNMFPPDPSMQRQVQVQLPDSAQDPQQRTRFLADLVSLGRRSGAGKRVLDSDALHGAIELAVTTTDPALRAGIWQAMRDVGDPELLQPLLASLREDPDGDVRLQAVNTLVENFVADPRVHTALETTAQQDRRPLVRALAQRALDGETAWQQYVVASLKDTSRPAAERIEALVHHLCPPGPRSGSCIFRVGGGFSLPTVRDLLDDEAIQALAQVLPGAGATPLNALVTSSLVGQLSSIDRPTATGLLLDILDRATQLQTRTAIVGHLARRTSDPRVRAALEKISAGDEDSQLREKAATALKSAAVPVAQ